MVIHPLADDRRELPVEKAGRLFFAPPDFMLAISYNPGYQSVLKDLKPSTRQRFVSLSFSYPEPDLEARIVMREGGVDAELAGKLVKLAGMTRGLKESGLPEGASTRLLIQAAQPNTVLERALDVLFILHADHEQNCSTSTMRGIGSAWADPYTAVAGAAGALSGPLHGGANEAALLMLAGIGSPSRVPAFLKRVKAGEARLAGFGHRIYTVCDPRAAIIKRMADLVFAVTGSNPLLEVALELERIAREDEWFVTRHLYPNVDFYSGLIYQAMGFPPAMFPVLFAVPRTVGWLAQWRELVADPEQRIARPRQIYAGQARREYVPRDKRKQDA